MKRVMILLACVCFIGIGCKKEAPPAVEQVDLVTYSCPDCGTEADADAYCAHCNAVASSGDTVACEKCAKEYKEGQYCAECNRFVFDDPYFCATENREFKKGTYCPKEGAYRGLSTVKYCPDCQKPFDGKLEKCPACGK